MFTKLRAYAHAQLRFSDVLYFSMAFVGVYALVGFVRVALAAQTDPQAVVDAGLSGTTWHWMTVAVGALAYLATLVDPANSDTKWSWPVSWRIAAFTGIGIVVGVLHYILNHGSVPFSESFVTAITTIVVPQLLHFAPMILQWLKTKGAPAAGGAGVLVLCSALVSQSVGCAALFPGFTTGSVIADLDSYELAANAVSTWGADAWAVVAPNATPQEVADYNTAQASLKTSIQLAQDAAAAYQAGQGPTPNWPAIFGAVATAADQLVALIESFGTQQGVKRIRMSEAAFASKLSQLKAAQVTLHRYKAP